ncbi:MAG TPA: DNA-binding protein [Stenotrophomonas sp.]|nr:DNA-binding protein [Stenotrophomonas sp.]
MAKPQLKTPEQVRQELEDQGVSIADFARQHGLNPTTVYHVLDGSHKGRRGEAHRAAVALGLKAAIAVPASKAPRNL